MDKVQSKLNRRAVVKSLALGGAGVAIGGPLLARGGTAQAAATPVKVAVLKALAKEWSTAEFELGGEPALLVRVPALTPAADKKRALEASLALADGKSEKVYLVAYSRVCTHMGCSVNLPDDKHELVCPCHHSAFTADSGGVVQGPARKALAGIKLEVKDGTVYATGTL